MPRLQVNYASGRGVGLVINRSWVWARSLIATTFTSHVHSITITVIITMIIKRPFIRHHSMLSFTTLASPAMGHWGTSPSTSNCLVFCSLHINSNIGLYVAAHPEKNIQTYI